MFCVSLNKETFYFRAKKPDVQQCSGQFNFLHSSSITISVQINHLRVLRIFFTSHCFSSIQFYYKSDIVAVNAVPFFGHRHFFKMQVPQLYCKTRPVLVVPTRTIINKHSSSSSSSERSILLGYPYISIIQLDSSN